MTIRTRTIEVQLKEMTESRRVTTHHPVEQGIVLDRRGLSSCFIQPEFARIRGGRSLLVSTATFHEQETDQEAYLG